MFSPLPSPGGSTVSREVPYTVMLIANPGGILWDPDGILALQWTRINLEKGVGAVGSRIPSDPSEIPLKVAARTAPRLAFHGLVGRLAFT